MRSDDAQQAMTPCAYCRTLFSPKRPWAAFCSTRCRCAYNVEVGATGKVASVRRLRKGASVVVHLEGPAAEQALHLSLRELVRLVRKP